MTSLRSFSELSLEALVCQAQGGDSSATEALLEKFRPLLRAQMHRMWTAVRENLTTLEWADIEAQVTLLFLSRLQSFRPEAGVFFPVYAERMLEFDGRSWLRQQQRAAAVPFSQLPVPPGDNSSDPEDWLLPVEPDTAQDVERTLSLRNAVEALPPAQKVAVWQCCVLGKTEADLAKELGISRSAVRNRLESALTALRSEMGVTQARTRTGRASYVLRTPRQEFWSFILNMAKDEKRPDLVGVGDGRPVLLQGTFDFPATGLRNPQLLSPKLRYVVPAGAVAGIRFCRAGIMCDKMVCISTVVNGMPHRLIPVAANTATHVAFAIVEPLTAGSEIEIHVASDAPGTAIIDVGCLQMPA